MESMKDILEIKTKNSRIFALPLTLDLKLLRGHSIIFHFHPSKFHHPTPVTSADGSLVRLNSIHVRYSEKLSQKTRFQIRKQIKALGNERRPIISLYTLENEAYAPHKFFLYLESCLLTFLLMIDMMNQSGKTAFKISDE